MSEEVALDDTQDYYTPDPGTHAKDVVVHCGVCGEAMTVHYDVVGPRGFVQAMSGSKSPHDAYACPRRNEDWHKQIVALRQEARRTPSGRLAKMFRDEANEVLETRQKTK